MRDRMELFDNCRKIQSDYLTCEVIDRGYVNSKTMSKIPSFSAEEMFHLCDGTDELAKFDLSSISQEFYEKFFGGLPNILYNRVRSIEFRADLVAGNMGKLSKK